MLRLRSMLAGLAVLGALSVSAQADTVTFASFQPTNTTPANPFKYDQNGQKAGSGGVSYFVTNTAPIAGTGSPAAPLNVTPTAIPVNFTFSSSNIFTAGLPAALMGNQAANLILDARSRQAVNVIGGFAIQQQVYGTLEIRRATPLNGKDLLLKVEFGKANDPTAGGNYSGTLNGQTTNLAADDAVGDYVVFTSDFINFASLGTDFENINLNFTSARPRLSKNTFTNFFTSHTASGSGTFSAEANPVPEPATIACAVSGLLFAVVGLRRRAAKS